MIGRRIWIVVGVAFLAQAFIVRYENHTDDWFSANEQWTIGLPWWPWYERTWWSNPIEGGGDRRVRLVSPSIGLLLVGAVMLWGAWYTKDFVAELEAEKRANASNPSPTEV